MKTILTAIAILLIGAFVVVGPSHFAMSAKGFQGWGKSMLVGATAPEAKIESLKAAIRKAEKKLFQLEAAAAMSKGDARAVTRQEKELESVGEKLEREVGNGKQLLMQDKSEYSINGQQLTFEELADVVRMKAEKLGRVRQDLADIRNNGERYERQAQLLAKTRRDLEAEIRSEKHQLKDLIQRYHRATKMNDVAQLVADVGDMSNLFSDSPYRKYKRELWKDTLVLEAENRKVLGENGEAYAGIDLSSVNQPQSPKGLMEEIDALSNPDIEVGTF